MTSRPKEWRQQRADKIPWTHLWKSQLATYMLTRMIHKDQIKRQHRRRPHPRHQNRRSYAPLGLRGRRRNSHVPVPTAPAGPQAGVGTAILTETPTDDLEIGVPTLRWGSAVAVGTGTWPFLRQPWGQNGAGAHQFRDHRWASPLKSLFLRPPGVPRAP